ncbi:NADH oxidase [Gammaproteobacteria bacterium]|nr:NADH oxidase [Gammaproteobacteria bacterium]
MKLVATKKYPNLFSPIKIGPYILKNRICTAPMGASDLTPEGYLTRQNIASYRQKAKSGVAVVNLGEALVDSVRGKAHGRMVALDDVEILSSLIDCCDAIKQHGALVAIELIHAGCRARPEYCQKGPVGPSAHMGIYGEMVEELNDDLIEEIVESFGKAAFMARCGGVNIITLHACHGWIFSQFLAKSTNQRTDKYGGSLENRARFSLMVIERVRKYCGPQCPIEFRMSGSDLYDGGITIEESIEYAKMLDDKVDLFHISAGSFNVPDTSTRMFPSMYLAAGVNVPFAEAIKKAVKTPVATVGGLGCDPIQMEEIIASGQADIINIARASVADTDIVNKIKQGREDEITTCLRCNYCLSLSFVPHVPFAVRVLRCAVNPIIGFELETQSLLPALNKKKVLVVGSGPGGMQAALTSIERGHDVLLCEKADRLGGLLNTADHVSFKHNMKKYKESLIARVNKSTIKVMLNTEVTPDFIDKNQPDALIVAVGAEVIIPNIPGIDLKNVMFAARDYGKESQVGQKVVVIGGGLVGCEEGLYYKQLGRDVTILEMTSELAKESYYLHLRATLNEMEDAQVKVNLNTKCTKIIENGVYAVNDNGEEHFFEADTVLVSVGLKPLSHVVESLRDLAEEFSVVGDCFEAKTITEAVRTGYNAAITL